jgi:hypothetical protein
VIHQEWIGQAGAVERAVNLHGHNYLGIALACLDDIQLNIHGEDFLSGPFFDRSNPTELSPHVLDDGIICEAGLQRSSVTGIDCANVSFNRLWQFHFVFIRLLRSWECFRRR